MPLVNRKRRLNSEENQLNRECKRFKTGNKRLWQFDNIGYVQDQFHSIHRCIPNELEELQKILAKELGSFLNGKGGILCFGCRANGTVYGEPLPRKQEDIIKLVIDEVFKKFRPMVQPQRYRVTCTPLSDRYRMNECPKLVVEIRVQAGDDYEMYEDYNHETYLRRSDAPYGPLTPHEIKRFTTQQLRQKLNALRPIQKALLTPTKDPLPEIVKPSIAWSVKKPAVEKTKFRIRLKHRHNSSGSDEDPISVAVVKPLVSSVTGKDKPSQPETKKLTTTDTSRVGDNPTARGASKTQSNKPISHPLAQAVRSVTKPSQPETKKLSTTDTSRNGDTASVPNILPSCSKNQSISHPLAQAVKSVTKPVAPATKLTPMQVVAATPTQSSKLVLVHSMMTRSQRINSTLATKCATIENIPPSSVMGPTKPSQLSVVKNNSDTNPTITNTAKTPLPTKGAMTKQVQSSVMRNNSTVSMTTNPAPAKTMSTCASTKTVAATHLSQVKPATTSTSVSTKPSLQNSAATSVQTIINSITTIVKNLNKSRSAEATKIVPTNPVLNNHTTSSTVNTAVGTKAVAIPVNKVATTIIKPQEMKVVTGNIPHSQSAKKQATEKAKSIAMTTCKKPIPLQQKNHIDTTTIPAPAKLHRSCNTSHPYACYSKPSQQRQIHNYHQHQHPYFPPPPLAPPQFLAQQSYYQQCYPYPPNNAPYFGSQSAVQTAWNYSAQNLRKH